jgi:threonine dehydratase
VRPTVSDGIAVGRPSDIAFSLIEQHVDDIVAVDDPPATEAVALLLERAKLLVEPSGAVTMAAILEGRVAGDGPAVAVLSGGNIDLLLLDSLVRYGQESRGRFAAFNVQVPDQPGQLAQVLAIIGDSGANVLSVEHHREGAGLPYGVVGIQISIATRSHEHQEQIQTRLEAHGVTLAALPGT